MDLGGTRTEKSRCCVTRCRILSGDENESHGRSSALRTSLSHTAIQIKSTLGLISVQERRRWGGGGGCEDGIYYPSLSSAAATRRPSEGSLAAASGFCFASSIMYLDHGDESSFTQLSIFKRWVVKWSGWIKLQAQHSQRILNTVLTPLFIENGSVMEGHGGSVGGSASWWSAAVTFAFGSKLEKFCSVNNVLLWKLTGWYVVVWASDYLCWMDKLMRHAFGIRRE